ncbi:MAG TPA: response regulator transcription factor [Candidatus Saccharimonadales bacterium]|nr:response regulator transcription factor [Candidatus Saccharimonadales bacterium]
MTVTVLLADDSEIMRRSIRRLLEEYPEIVVLAETTSFPETVQMATALKPDVILLDLHMPNPANMSMEQVKAACSACRVLAISIFNDEETRTIGADLGAACLLDKADLGMKLVPAINKLRPTATA